MKLLCNLVNHLISGQNVLYKIILSKGHNCFTADVQERWQLIEKGYFIHFNNKMGFKKYFLFSENKNCKIILKCSIFWGFAYNKRFYLIFSICILEI